MKRTTITIIDIIAYLVNDLLAWFIVIWFDLTGYDNKFQKYKIALADFDNWNNTYYCNNDLLRVFL